MRQSADGAWSRRILQIHPTRRCNLRCVHCYSDSGPEESDELPLSLITRLLDDAAAEAYAVAGFSGGEPTLYPALPDAVGHAHTLGLCTTVTSNGTTFTESMLRSLEGRLDLLAISIDGVPESHAEIRASRFAFDRMRSKLDLVRESQIPFGFIFTLTLHNLDALLWVADFAVSQGASLLQIHPLEMSGRALSEMRDENPDGLELAHAFLLIERLREIVGDELFVQFDASDREVLRADPARVLGECFAGADRPLADFLAPLVLEADGELVPVRHGMARRYSLGNLSEAPLPELKRRWLEERSAAFAELRRATLDELLSDESALPFFNWFDVLAQRSEAEAAHLPERPSAAERSGDSTAP